MTKSVEIERSDNDPYFHKLMCPSCGESFLHHRAVRVFNRDQDEEIGLETTISDKCSRTRMSSHYDNPSLRRDGLTIDFHCEHCANSDADHVVAQLCIAQHKGHTGVFWRRIC